MQTRCFWPLVVLVVCAAMLPAASHGYCGAGPFDDRGNVIVAAGNQNVTIEMKRYSLYSPELQLVAETNTSAVTPWIANEYVWFNGEPLAQVNVPSGEVAYSFNDHLGAPILQTDAAGAVVWRVERDPYGERYATRVGAERHQPLGLPGHEHDASSDRQYNIARWLRPSWGRYTQADPIDVKSGDFNLYRYGLNNPLRFADPLGLDVRICCRPVKINLLAGWDHCYLESGGNRPRKTWGLQRVSFRGLGPIGIAAPWPNHPDDTGGVCESWRPDPCGDLERCLGKASRDYPVHRYSDFGANVGVPGFRNSNTFAKCVASRCSLSAGPRVTADAPGWVQQCPAGF